MEHLIWRVIPTASPKLIKRCGRCGHSHFINSGRFRVNANGSRIDVWLIWKCEKCSATWNMDILSRVRADDIDRALYQRFLANDVVLALNLSLDHTMLSRNGAALDLNTLIVKIEGEKPPANDGTGILLIPSVPLGVCAARLIAQKLCISQSAVRRMVEEGLLESDTDIRKKKLNNPVLFILQAGWNSMCIKC